MRSDLLERASRFQIEAGELMKTIRLIESLQMFGEVILTDGVIFFEGLREPAEITGYLVSNGIHIN